MPPVFILAFATPFVLALAPAVLPAAFLFTSPPAAVVAGAVATAATAPTPELSPELRAELDEIARNCGGTITGSPGALTATCADGTTIDYDVPPAHRRGFRVRLVGSPAALQPVAPSLSLEELVESCHDDNWSPRTLVRRDDNGARCEFGDKGYIDWSATNDGRTHIVGEIYEPQQ